MKKLIFSSAFLFAAFIASAQSMKEINTMVALRQFSKAKPAIDALLADPKNAGNAEAWYTKGEIYNNLSVNDTTLNVDTKYQLRKDAFEAYKKAQEVDPKDKYLSQDQHRPYAYLYSELFESGVAYFNAKDFANATNAFKSALDVHAYINSKGYKYADAQMTAFDTALVLNTGIAAFQAKNDDEGRRYYQMLIDNDASAPQFVDQYEYMASYYVEQNKPNELKKVVDKGRRFFPESDYWNQAEIDLVKKAGSKDALIAKYEEILAAHPDNFNTAYNYAVELFNIKFGSDPKAAEAMPAEKVQAAIELAQKNDKGISSANMMANFKYNLIYDVNDQIVAVKGTKPADVQKRNNLKAQMLKQVDDAIPYSQRVISFYEALPTMNTSQLINFNNQVGHMSEYYKLKGDLKKSAEWKSKEKK